MNSYSKLRNSIRYIFWSGNLHNSTDFQFFDLVSLFITNRTKRTGILAGITFLPLKTYTMFLIYDSDMRKGTRIRNIDGLPFIKPFIVFIFHLYRADFKTCTTAYTAFVVHELRFLFYLDDKITVRSQYFLYFTGCHNFNMFMMYDLVH